MKEVQIIIATHKAYEIPKDDMYLPVQVGAEGKDDLGYTRDNTGDNISSLNPDFCELTGMYWAWKNVEAEYIGLVHYRRHFAKGPNKRVTNPMENVLDSAQLLPMLERYQIFVPKKRRYYIETLYSHYEHTHYIEQLDKAREIIGEKHKEYLPSFDRVVKRRSGYMFNMMIMRKDWLARYCTWLFSILFEMKKELEGKEFSAYQGRFYGRISEIIFNVWLDYQLENGLAREQVKELPYIHIGEINWVEKGTSFLKAKFLGKKYENSF